MQYWALINNVKVGPLYFDQLCAIGVKRATLVWREGLRQWMPADRVPELMQLFPQHVSRLVQCPPTYLAWAVVLTLLCCLPAGIVAIVYSSNVESKYAQGDLAGAQRASQNAQIWCILSFVLGIIGLPFAFITGMPFNWLV